MDPAVKKSVLRLFTYGLYAVTAKHGEEASGMTANWLIQTSFDPPLITLAAEVDSHTRQLIEACGGVPTSCAVLLELGFLGGRAAIGDLPLHALRTL